MGTSERSEPGCSLQENDAVSTSSDRDNSGHRRRKDPGRAAASRVTPTTPSAPSEVKKHQHKHNLRHRYEVMETLGRGAYGKVKRAMERATQRTVSDKLQHHSAEMSKTTIPYSR